VGERTDFLFKHNLIKRTMICNGTCQSMMTLENVKTTLTMQHGDAIQQIVHIIVTADPLETAHFSKNLENIL
ncbi:hypothetical protein COBT_003702, partial [Conglomerata obtusa]